MNSKYKYTKIFFTTRSGHYFERFPKCHKKYSLMARVRHKHNLLYYLIMDWKIWFESFQKNLKGNIYLGKVSRIEASLHAFVDIGSEKNSFLAFGEIHPNYFQIPVADRGFNTSWSWYWGNHNNEEYNDNQEGINDDELGLNQALVNEEDDTILNKENDEKENNQVKKQYLRRKIVKLKKKTLSFLKIQEVIKTDS